MWLSRRTTQAVGAVIALMLLECALVNNASAGCGDYLTVGGVVSQESEASRAADAPCHGPNCRRGDLPPLAPVPEVQAPPSWSKSACVIEDTEPERLHVSQVIEILHFHPAAGYTTAILRPPRSV